MRRTNLLAMIAGLLTLAMLTGAVRAADTIKTLKASLSGEITEITPIEVTINRAGDKTDKVPVNEIDSIRFDNEPAQMLQVRNAITAGRNQDALKFLEKIDADGIENDNIKCDIEFYKALAAARLALGGTGSIADAGKAMNKFVKDYPNSYHYLQANETIGDLLVGSAAYDKAEPFYKKVEDTAPWPDYKMRAGVAKGRTLIKQGKAAEALPVFDSVLKLAEGQQGDLVARQKLMAQVGKAECLAATGAFDEGVALIESLIGEANPEETELHALAYNALGNCHRKAGRPKDARRAFLHVHLLFSAYPEAHAEALANLVELWKELGDGERSLEAQGILQSRYANSKWAKGA
jgi:tetratricopeptide (TPR) repeat protein